MINHAHDANDGSVQEIAVNHENPISNEHPFHPEGRYGSAAHVAPFEGIPISVCPRLTDQSEPGEIVDEGAAPSTQHTRPILRNAVTVESAADKIVKLPLDRLLRHPFNEKLYGATSPKEINELAYSIKEVGQQVPLLVTANLEKIGYYTLLSGHKRADALRSLNRTEADCQKVDVQDADERLLRLLEANRQHVPTMEQKIRIAEVYFDLETKKAKARQVAGAKVKKGSEVVEVFTQPTPPPAKTGDDTAGKARDLAAAKVGISGVSFDKGRKVLRAMEKAVEQGRKEAVAELRQLLNEKGIDPAHERAKVLHLIEQAKRSSGTGGKAKVNVGGEAAATQQQNPAPVSKGTESNNEVRPPVVPPAETGEDETVPLQAKDSLQVPSHADATVNAGEAEVPPPVVSIVTACNKLVDALEKLDPAELTISQKWNLNRAFDAISKWFGNHEQALKLADQL